MQIALLSGAYESRSIIASAQRCVNLYPQVNQKETFMYMPALAGAPTVLTHYPTPGLTAISSGAPYAAWRGLYAANNGTLYGVCGGNVYAITQTTTVNVTLTLLGTIASATNPVSMADNGITLVLVDGTPNGYTIDLATNAFAPLVDPTGAFVGADSVNYVDTFFIFNVPGTRKWYTSLSNSTTFDPLYLVAKTGYADNLVQIAVCQRQIWLLGVDTTEIWYDAGAASFPFAIVAGPFIQHGCVAKYSVCTQDAGVFWLSRDPQGQAIVMMGANYSAVRISTHAIEHQFATYATVSDAIGYIYQEEGHMFYVLNFPSADKTWVYDMSTQVWHERAYLDSNGIEHRHRSNCGAFAYGKYIVGDWQNGNLYFFDENNYTDNGAPIKRVRSFPHVLNELKRVMYRQFIADIQCGTLTDPTQPYPIISLRWSDDRGASWSDYITKPMGRIGETFAVVKWMRCGMARDRVFELSWSSAVPTALNGAFIEIEQSAA
jgi:hypothetical protein